MAIWFLANMAAANPNARIPAMIKVRTATVFLGFAMMMRIYFPYTGAEIQGFGEWPRKGAFETRTT